jgi:endonuclease/exonuclease/phosphatase family metal-dependent hydrolase
MLKYINYSILILLSVLFFGCPTTKETVEEKPILKPQKPVVETNLHDITINVASIDLAKSTKKIEAADIDHLYDAVKNEKIDIIAMQGITRYPELKSRIDIVNEFSSRSSMRYAFGETVGMSGRQSGNAVFSNYPIRSNENKRYENIKSTNLESALSVVIDCGVRDLVLVSTRLPDKSSTEDRTTCLNVLSSYSFVYSSNPIVIAGNLPESQKAATSFLEAKPQGREVSSHIWFSDHVSIKLLNTKAINTPFGVLMIAEFGIFRKPQP